MTTRNVARAATVGAIIAVSLVAMSPAFAVVRDDGDEPGPPLSRLATLLIFVVVPVGLFLLITLLVLAPSIARGPRYRPGLEWQANPQWFGDPEHDRKGTAGGPEGPEHSPQELPAESGAAHGSEPGDAGRTGRESSGGTSARW